MQNITKEKIIDILKDVMDPDRGGNIVDLGMVHGLQVKDGHVSFAIEVDPERGSKLEPLRKEVESLVHNLPGVITATVVLTAERSKSNDSSNSAKEDDNSRSMSPNGSDDRHNHSHSSASQIPKSVNSESSTDLLVGVKSLVAVASGKGGVGKSTTAVNIAMGLAASGLAVGLLDADIYGPSLPRMMGISGRPNSLDGKNLEPLENYGVKVMSMGFLVEEDTPMIWRGPMVQSALEQMMRDVKWGNLDSLIIDMPPGTGDAQLTMAQRVPLTGAVIVSTPQDIALLDARKGLNMFRKVEVPVLGIVENMSYFSCPHCNKHTNIFGHGGAKETADDLETTFLGEIPLHIDIRETSDEGHPIVVSKPNSEHAKAYQSVADDIWRKIAEIQASGSSTGPKIIIQ